MRTGVDPIRAEIEEQVATLKRVCERLGLLGVPSGPIQVFIKELENQPARMSPRMP
jgi:hypothetical protein